jgi:hypothetical protein
VDDASLECGDCRLRTIAHTHTAEDNIYVALHSTLGNPQLCGNLLIASPFYDQTKDITLAISEGGIGRPGSQALRDRRGYHPQPGIYFQYGIDERLTGHALDEVRLRAGL